MTASCLPAEHASRPAARRAATWPALLLLLLLACAAPAAAQSCWVGTGPTIAFGEVGTGGKDASATLSVTCQRDWFQFASFRLCMAIPDGTPIAGTNPRWMSNYNGAQMAYDLYSDAARTRQIGPFGSGYPTYSATLSMNAALDFQATVNMPIYGRARAGQQLPATHAYQSQIGGGQIRYSYNTASVFNPNPAPPSEAQCLSGNGASGSGIAGFHTSVTATFANTCRITTATDLDFGVVTALTANRDQTSSIQLQCPNGTPWRVGLDNGSHAVGNTRRMAGPGGHFLQYELYRNVQRNQRWGTALGTDTSAGTGNNASQSVTVYGRVPAQAIQRAGAYSDTVTITLTY